MCHTCINHHFTVRYAQILEMQFAVLTCSCLFCFWSNPQVRVPDQNILLTQATFTLVCKKIDLTHLHNSIFKTLKHLFVGAPSFLRKVKKQVTADIKFTVDRVYQLRKFASAILGTLCVLPLWVRTDRMQLFQPAQLEVLCSSPPRPYSLFLEHGSTAKTLISHPHNTASYAGYSCLGTHVAKFSETAI